MSGVTRKNEETKIWYLESQQKALLKSNKIYLKKIIIYNKQWKIFIQSKREKNKAKGQIYSTL